MKIEANQRIEMIQAVIEKDFNTNIIVTITQDKSNKIKSKYLQAEYKQNLNQGGHLFQELRLPNQ